MPPSFPLFTMQTPAPPAPPAVAQAQFAKPFQVLFTPKRYKVFYGGRSAGRSWGFARALLLKAVKEPIRVLCARELQKSISESVHKLLSDQIELMGLGQFFKIQRDTIEGVNGSGFFFEGIKNNVNKIKSYEGIDICWVEEANKVSKNSWNVLIPTIRKKSSEIWITFNPELEDDYTYQRFVLEPDLERTVVVKMTYRDNPWFTDDMEAERLDLLRRDPDAHDNVWEGNCLVVLDGMVYAKEIRRIRAQGRITDVPYDRAFPVDVWMDLGRADNTAMWFKQTVAMQHRCVRYYENTGEDIDHFIKFAKDTGYNFGTFYLPHDAKAKRLGSKRTIEEVMRQAGFKVHVLPRQSLTVGINAARLLLGVTWFDAKGCADGIRALSNYKYKVDDQGQLSQEPLHNWASDGADAFRYMALTNARHVEAQKPPSTFRRQLDRLRSSRGPQSWMT